MRAPHFQLKRMNLDGKLRKSAAGRGSNFEKGLNSAVPVGLPRFASDPTVSHRPSEADRLARLPMEELAAVEKTAQGKRIGSPGAKR